LHGGGHEFESRRVRFFFPPDLQVKLREQEMNSAWASLPFDTNLTPTQRLQASVAKEYTPRTTLAASQEPRPWLEGSQFPGASGQSLIPLAMEKGRGKKAEEC
jgi:hypothetical protein